MDSGAIFCTVLLVIDIDSTKGPFRDAVVKLYAWGHGLRFQDIAAGCDHVRSATWWNQVHNAKAVSPPAVELMPYLGKVLGFPAEAVAEMVAAQWYGVTKADVSERVARMAPLIDSLSEEMAAVLERMFLPSVVAVSEAQRRCPADHHADGDEPGQHEAGDLQGDHEGVHVTSP